MSDIERTTLQKAPILVERKCKCGDWACFGFQKGGQDEWWWWMHYPYKTAGRLEAAEIAESLLAKVA